MRYLLITYDEKNLPHENFDLFAKLSYLLETERVDSALVELASPAAVQEQVEASRLEEGGTVEQRLLLALQEVLPYAESRLEDLCEAKEAGGEDEDYPGAREAAHVVSHAAALIRELTGEPPRSTTNG